VREETARPRLLGSAMGRSPRTLRPRQWAIRSRMAGSTTNLFGLLASRSIRPPASTGALAANGAFPAATCARLHVFTCAFRAEPHPPSCAASCISSEPSCVDMSWRPPAAPGGGASAPLLRAHFWQLPFLELRRAAGAAASRTEPPQGRKACAVFLQAHRGAFRAPAPARSDWGGARRYDFEKFLDKHPGGATIMKMARDRCPPTPCALLTPQRCARCAPRAAPAARGRGLAAAVAAAHPFFRETGRRVGRRPRGQGCWRARRGVMVSSWWRSAKIGFKLHSPAVLVYWRGAPLAVGPRGVPFLSVVRWEDRSAGSVNTCCADTC
jgi:hypothetical protein